jgi:DNA-binding PadR family transcriptional regulator
MKGTTRRVTLRGLTPQSELTLAMASQKRAHAMRRAEPARVASEGLTYVRDGHILIRMKTKKTLSPLTPAVFYILLALATEDKHGYQIMKQVKQDSQGQVTMGTGTLYGSIKRMLADGLIEEVGDRPDPEFDDERRRYYRLTDLGRRAFSAELARYHEVVSLAHQRRLFPGPQLETTI